MKKYIKIRNFFTLEHDPQKKGTNESASAQLQAKANQPQRNLVVYVM